jgi:hypothetical protein
MSVTTPSPPPSSPLRVIVPTNAELILIHGRKEPTIVSSPPIAVDAEESADSQIFARNHDPLVSPAVESCASFWCGLVSLWYGYDIAVAG